MNNSWTPPPLVTTTSAPSVLNRQKVVVRPDPSFMLFDSSESDNEDHSNFPGGGSDSRKTSKAEFPGRGGDSRKTSHVTPKSRPVARRPPKRVQFGPDEPDEDQQPRQQSDLGSVQQSRLSSQFEFQCCNLLNTQKTGPFYLNLHFNFEVFKMGFKW